VVTEKKNLLETKLTNRNSTISKLEDDLLKAHGALDSVVLGRRSEGTALLQAESFRQENARLLAMLAKTKEFGNFASVAIASGESGVRYMQSEKPSTPASPPKAESNSDDNEEADSWIPETAYKVAHDFRAKCAANVSKAMMNTMLEDLNKIWRVREKKQIARIKGDANREV